MKTITVNLGERSYPIIIGRDNLAGLGDYIKKLNLGNDVFLITTESVGKLYADTVVSHLKKSGINEIYTAKLPDGEQAKTLVNWERMLSEITDFDNGMNKRIVIVNLGGGVIGDLGGFVAATYRRGINFVQVPTTLLANVDSGVGGKVAVNFKDAKNLIGSFYQPRLVYVDLTLLKSLPIEEMRAGLAEVVKYGVIADKELFEYLEKNYSKILAYDLDALEHIILRSYEIKARIVELDERDTKGDRAALNFGHTFGHAIEAATHYGRYRHGEAVAIGMVCAAGLGMAMGTFTQGDSDRLENLLKSIGLPTRYEGCVLADIMKSLAHDKKFVNKKNRLIVPHAFGKITIEEGIDEDLIEKIISEKRK